MAFRKRLNYITDERKKWREKIRTISAQIERCDFQGTDELRIEQYLVQLQMNINPYGSVYKENNSYYYKRDAYLWDAIDEIKNAPNKELFDKNKELLLRYLSFMLKMDWERSKKEVKNFSTMKILWILTVVFCTAIFLYECFILKLGNSEEGFLYFGIDVIMMFIGFVGLVFFCEYDMPQYKNENIWSLKKTVLYQTRGKIVSFCVLGITSFVMIISSLGFGIAVPELMVRNMTYYTDNNGQVYLYPNFNEMFFPDFQVKLQKKLGRKVIILENRDSETEIAGLEIDYDDAIYDVLSKTFIVIFIAKFIRNFLIMGSVMLFDEIDDIDRSVEFGLKYTKYMIIDEYEKTVRETLLMIERVTETFKDSNLQKENDELLGLSYEFLHRAKEELSHQLYIVMSQMKNIQQWEVKNQMQQCINLIEDSIKLLKKFSGTKRDRVKLNILIELKSNLETVIDII